MIKRFAFVLILNIVIAAFTSVQALTLEFTESEIQQKVDEISPFVKTKYFVTFQITNPRITLLESVNRIRINSGVIISNGGKVKGAGHVIITGTLRYDKQKAAFFLNDTDLESITIDRVPGDKIKQIQLFLQKTAVPVLSALPVFSFKDDNIKHQIAKSTLKSILIKGKTLFVELDLL
ncbi:MAG: DUF1439 domain-containing protein [Methylococcales bacterium]